MIRRRGTRVLAPVAAALVLLLAACAAPAVVARSYDVPPPQVGFAEFHPDVPASIAIIGDSTTAWDYAFGGDPTLSWVSTASTWLPVVCGWAESGATVARMLETATPCPDARFLVLMGGTNDIPGNTPIPERLAAVDAIVATVGAQYPVLLHVAPLDRYGDRVNEWNAALTAHAQQRGWLVLDPWASAREPTGAFVPGTAIYDNVHPTPETAVVVGTYIAESLTLASRFLK